MSDRRLVVHIGEIVIEASAAAAADLGALEAEVRAGIAAAFAGGAVPPAFARSAPALEAVHPDCAAPGHGAAPADPDRPGPGLGAAIAAATPPGRPS